MLFHPIGTWSADAVKQMERKLLNALGIPEKDHAWARPQFKDVPNVKWITENDFWWHKSSYTEKAQAHCLQSNTKIEIDGTADWWDMWLFWDDRGRDANGGFGVLWCYNQKKTKYFRWAGCDHDWNETSPRMCYHVGKCEKCGATYDYHSD